METKEILEYREKKAALQQLRNKLDAQMEVTNLKIQEIKDKLAKKGIAKEDVPATVAKLKTEISEMETTILSEIVGIQKKAKDLGIEIPDLIPAKAEAN